MAAAGIVAAGIGVAGLLLTHHGTPGERPTGLVAALTVPTGTIAAPPEPSVTRQVAEPVSLTIPVIAVRTQLVHLGLTATGALQVPPTTAVAGWYTGSSRPGAIGPAIIDGHIDSYQGPGIFFRLVELRPGDRVYIRRADGTLVVFRVVKVQTYLKDHFPTEAVYGPTPDAELRLITCGGAFDSATGHYLSNVVVYAIQAT
jgi:sortase (surface protein transpeptidase)